MTDEIKRVIIHMDSESLGLHHSSIVREIAFLAVDAEDPETIVREVEEHLPLRIQETMNRLPSLDTFLWLVDQPKSVIDTIKQNLDGDMDELVSLVRSIIRKFGQVIEGREYEVWFARPQFDIPLIESLFKNCGEELPWKYDKVKDLRTLMDLAGIPIRSPELEPLKQGLILHTAKGDCKFQNRCYQEAMRLLRARS